MQQVSSGLKIPFLRIVLFAIGVVAFSASDGVIAEPRESDRSVVILRGLEGVTDSAAALTLRRMLNDALKQDGIDLFLFANSDYEYQLWGQVDASRQSHPNKIFCSWVAYDRYGSLVGVELRAITIAGAARNRQIPKTALQAIARAAVDAISSRRKLVARDVGPR